MHWKQRRPAKLMFQSVQNNWSLNSCQPRQYCTSTGHHPRTSSKQRAVWSHTTGLTTAIQNNVTQWCETVFQAHSLVSFNIHTKWCRTHSHLQIVNSRTHWQNAPWAMCLFLYTYFKPWHILSTLFIQENKIYMYTCRTLIWEGQCNSKVIHIHTEKHYTSHNLRDCCIQMWNLKTMICCSTQE